MLSALAGAVSRLTRTALSALAFHYAQLEATAFREEFDPSSFEDHTLPKNDTIRKKAGPLIREWVKLLQNDKSADAVIAQTSSKRKSVSPARNILGHHRKRSLQESDSRLTMQDISLSEAEVRSRYETGSLMQVRITCTDFGAPALADDVAPA